MPKNANDTTEISKILKRLRGNKSLTEQAKDLNYTLSLLSYVNSGKKPIGRKMLNRMIKFYNLTDSEIEEIKEITIPKRDVEFAEDILSKEWTSEELALHLRYNYGKRGAK